MKLQQPSDVDPLLVDFADLGHWMDGQGLPPGEFTDVAELTGGTQNIMLRLSRGGQAYVLRRPPRHLRSRSNDALIREMRVLEALATTPVPVPQIVAGCDDLSVLGGAAFYLMKYVDGFNANMALPPLHASDARIRREMGLNAARAIATLGEVDYVAVGLADVGKPAGFIERQVGRWLAELDSYSTLDCYPGLDIPGVAPVARWLERNCPSSWRRGLMHGDYHLSNIMFSHHSSQVAAIVDWEMVTVGDPLLDLGWLLATWPGPDGVAWDSAIGGAGGLPTRDDIISCYADCSSRDLTSITWYHVLACFKLGIVLEGTHARACAGQAAVDVGDRLHAHAVDLFTQACSLI